MEKEQELMLKQALIEQELEFFRNQLKTVRLFMSEHQNELSSPSSPMSQEENVSVQKNIEQQEIGICKQKTYLPRKAMEEKLERVDILQLAKSRIEIFINKVFSFSADDKIFVNGYDTNEKTLIYSKYRKEISLADEQLFLAFQNSLLKPDLIGEHVADIYKTL
ncbi:unnamed protein product [Lactuca virosa]|uniref:Uncharacterized protein n=1 Tax=Lactuca virosa TaxID=75947 RepID=A0AAU9LGF3_9ASTR|nr:unnamed protein product [Lactuca virosa]